jgi:hypothetical protein
MRIILEEILWEVLRGGYGRLMKTDQMILG